MRCTYRIYIKPQFIDIAPFNAIDRRSVLECDASRVPNQTEFHTEFQFSHCRELRESAMGLNAMCYHRHKCAGYTLMFMDRRTK